MESDGEISVAPLQITSCDGPAIRLSSFLDFCMMEMGVYFLFYLSHYLALDSEQTGWLVFLFSTSQSFRRTIFDDTLVLIDHMGRVIMGWLCLGWHGQKIPFPLRATVPLVAIKRGLAD